MHRFAVDTVIQYYFNDNNCGNDPFIDVVYKNAPKAYIHLDDDALSRVGLVCVNGLWFFSVMQDV